MPDHVTSNIEAVAALRATSQRRLPGSQKAIESITAALGRPRTLFVLLGAIGAWAAYNGVLAALTHLRRLDAPPFFWLQGAVALYAGLMTTMVLITQNRQNQEAEQRAHLELQVILLAEQRTAKIIGLLEELRRDLPSVKDRVDPVAEAMQEAVPPRAVMTALEQTMESPAAAPGGDFRDPDPAKK